jgi:hypothetical protein
VNHEWFADDVADLHRGIQRRVGILKDDLHLAAELAQLFLVEREHVLAGEVIRPAVGSIKRNRQRPTVDLPQPDSPTRPNVSPANDVERDAVNCADHLVRSFNREVFDEPANAHERLC